MYYNISLLNIIFLKVNNCFKRFIQVNQMKIIDDYLLINKKNEKKMKKNEINK